ncbi:MgtC/SapB family protein [Motilimonas cestriensis]|uniref:Protein MgtC n=1 Tax=Motilimonas cestriensis TaxID=2742685 RepID=A0ABS8W8Q8_9GAMM|nr:MgtC/SapB family protein [Motilimonas cestriensis]MCE2593936.1 MgtC/SapB family protein [Motilimonas cestriensis]
MFNTMLNIYPFDWHGILFCVICAGLIGFERQYRGKPVGIRTACLIVLGTYSFLKVGISLSPHSLDQARVYGQIITGVGFLGAGVMMSRDGQVMGVTSAASIWMLAAIGLMIGIGFERQALIITLLVLLILVGVDLLENSFKFMRQGVHAHFYSRKRKLIKAKRNSRANPPQAPEEV